MLASSKTIYYVYLYVDGKAGMAVIQVVHHQDLNKRILVTLIVASTLLCGILLFLLYFWICRPKIMKHSNGETKRNLGIFLSCSQSPLCFGLKVLSADCNFVLCFGF